MALKVITSDKIGTRVCANGSTTVVAEASRHELRISVGNNPGGNNPFESYHKETEGSIFNSKAGGGFPFFTESPSGFYNLGDGFINLPNVTTSEFTRLLAATNPSNANFSAPNFLFELKDLPDMIRQGGRIADALRRKKDWKKLIRKNKPSDLASANLAIQFGWAPFVSDMYQLATFQESVDKRRKMFQKLQTRGLRGKVDLGSNQSHTVTSTVMTSVCGFVYYVPVTAHKSVTRWGTIRWKANPSGQPLPRTDGELRRRMTGLTLDHVPLAVWEALPWSWLADYFVDIGARIKAGNRVLAIPSHACVMTEQVTTYEHPGRTISKTLDLSGGESRRVRRLRLPQPSVLPYSAAWPSLSPGQLSTLASLHVQRAKWAR